LLYVTDRANAAFLLLQENYAAMKHSRYAPLLGKNTPMNQSSGSREAGLFTVLSGWLPAGLEKQKRAYALLRITGFHGKSGFFSVFHFCSQDIV
jgi:hypothetical protein